MASVWRCDCCKHIYEKSADLTSFSVEGEPEEEYNSRYNREKEIREDWCKSCIKKLREFIKEFKSKVHEL